MRPICMTYRRKMPAVAQMMPVNAIPAEAISIAPGRREFVINCAGSPQMACHVATMVSNAERSRSNRRCAMNAPPIRTAPTAASAACALAGRNDTSAAQSDKLKSQVNAMTPKNRLSKCRRFAANTSYRTRRMSLSTCSSYTPFCQTRLNLRSGKLNCVSS